MKEMKYIIPKSTRAPILFDPVHEHARMAEPYGECSSAGFCIVFGHNGKLRVRCHGESMSLGGLKSQPKRDAALIEKMIQG